MKFVTYLTSQASGSALARSEATLEELRNVHAPHERTVRARLQPLSRFANLRALTLCRVFGNRRDPCMAVALRKLSASLEVAGRPGSLFRASQAARPNGMPAQWCDGMAAGCYALWLVPWFPAVAQRR